MTAEAIRKSINEACEVNLDYPDISILRQGRSKPAIFPLELFGNDINRWLVDAAHCSGAPLDYVAGSLLAVSAALIGNARRISPWDGWNEPAALWVGMVGDPSSNKSPAIDPIINIIRKIEDDIAVNFEDIQREWETKKETAKCAREQWEQKVDKAVKNGTSVPTMPEDAVDPLEVVRPRILGNDTSIEKLGLLLSVHNKGLLFQRDELSGWFGSFDKYSGKGADRAFWIESYGGRSYVIDRVKHNTPVRIPYLLVGIMGGIQPEKLTNLINGADDGFTSRFLWLWPDPIPPFRPLRAVDNSLMVNAMCRLSALSLDDDNGNICPRIIPLSEDATILFQQWRDEHYIAEQNIIGLLKSSYGKAGGQLLRLALTIEYLWWAISQDGQEPSYISKKAIAAAAHLIDSYFKPMAERVFGDAAIPEEERLAAILAKYIVKTKPKIINLRSIRRDAHLPGLRKADKVKVAVESLIEASWLFASAESTGRGRPREDYTINPKLWEVLK
jgi:hypothetical protein